MARYVLQPCKVREDQLVPQKDTEPVTFDWPQLCAKFASFKGQGRVALLNLGHLRVSGFLGLIRSAKEGQVTNFILLNQDRTGSIDWLMKKDPTFESRLIEVYRVEVAERDAKLLERDTTEVNPFREADKRRMVESVARR